MPCYTVIAVLMSTLLICCKKDKKDRQEPVKPPEIHALLVKEGSSRLYKNGEQFKPIGLPEDFLIHDFDFIGDRLVIVGYSADYDAKVLLDGELTSLGLNDETEWLRDMVVYGNKVYFLAETDNGFKYASGSSSWNTVNSPHGKSFKAHQFAILQNTLTVFGELSWLGVEDFEYRVCYWQEDKGFNMFNELEKSHLKGVSIQEENMYVAGVMNNKIGYWENKERFKEVQIPERSVAEIEGITVMDKDVYLCGNAMDDTRKAIYWKNGQPTFLADYISGAISITGHGKDVYVGGMAKPSESTNWLSHCWINGKLYRPLSNIPDYYISKIIVR